MTEFEYVAMAIVTALSVGRITRLVTWDTFPPSVWFRTKFDDLTKGGSWSVLVHCGYCFAVWAAFGVVLWGYWSDWNAFWWIINGVLAASYVGAIVMANDGDEG